ncbi:MAG: phosphatase PAP2 family protein [Clostridiaceae bacterium]
MNLKTLFNSRNYYKTLAVLSIVSAIALFTFNIPFDGVMYMVFISFACITLNGDIKENVNTKRFFIYCVPFLLFLFIMQKYGYQLWGKILEFEKSYAPGFDFNDIFDKIPFNDAAFARFYQPEWLNAFFRFVYNNGFVIPAIIPIYRSLIGKNFKKMMQYSLCAHIVQVIFISPFYAFVKLQEVWYVRGEPDMLLRGFTAEQAAGWTLNCFPSMHTSIAFAMFLLVIRENNKVFKYIWGAYCLLVVYSTMYLKIHWVIDVIGGLIFAYLIVKLIDFIISVVEKRLPSYIFKESESISA